MRQNERRFREILQKNYLLVIMAIGYAASIVSLIDPINNAYKQQNYVLMSVYVIFIVSCLFIAVFLFQHPKTKITPPKKNNFQGVGGINKENTLPRIEDRNRVYEAIAGTSSLQLSEAVNDVEIDDAYRPVILVGESGVGKSVLLDWQVKPLLEDNGWRCICFKNYDLFKDDLTIKLLDVFCDIDVKAFSTESIIKSVKGLKTQDEHAEIKKTLLIFDQFEQFLSINPINSTISEWFRKFLENSRHRRDLRFLIVIRKEWYYDLRILQDLVPPPIDALDLTGFRLGATETNELEGNFIKVTKNKDVAMQVIKNLTKNCEIFPIEAQIVGLMLENLSAGSEISKDLYKKIGGTEGLVQAYFDAYIKASPDPDITLEVLFALSVETRLRKQLKQSEIADIIHESTIAVSRNLEFLKNEGLVLMTSSGSYELAHDYMAEKFHEFSGSQLDAVKRDNIMFFWHELQKLPAGSMKVTRPDHTTAVFSDYFWAFLVVLLIIRITSPIIDIDWGWFNPLNKYENHFGIDIYYFPVFITHLAWSYYVTQSYRNFFSFLREGAFGKLCSKLTVIICTICVVTAVFMPHFWLLSIGVGGLAIGMKYIQLRYTICHGRNCEDVIMVRGTDTSINISFVILLGVLNIIYVHESTMSMQQFETYTIVMYALALPMTWYMFHVKPDHISKQATTNMIGLIDRGLVRLARLSSDN